MERNLAVLIPTRSRPGNLRAQAVCFAQTAATKREGVALIYLVDRDDPAYDQYQAAFDLTQQQLPMLAMQMVVAPVWMAMVHKLNFAAHLLAPEWHYLGFMGDDHWPRTEGWHRQMLGLLDTVPLGIAYGNDLLQRENLPTHWVMDSDIVQALDRMVPAPVEHLYCDNAVMKLGLALGTLRYLPDAVIEHMHPIANKAKPDDQYRRVNSPVQYSKDSESYTRWLRGGGPGRAAAKVREWVRAAPDPLI